MLQSWRIDAVERATVEHNALIIEVTPPQQSSRYTTMAPLLSVQHSPHAKTTFSMPCSCFRRLNWPQGSGQDYRGTGQDYRGTGQDYSEDFYEGFASTGHRALTLTIVPQDTLEWARGIQEEELNHLQAEHAISEAPHRVHSHRVHPR